MLSAFLKKSFSPFLSKARFLWCLQSVLTRLSCSFSTHSITKPAVRYSKHGIKLTGNIQDTLGKATPHLPKPFHASELKKRSRDRIKPAKQYTYVTDGNGCASSVAYALSESAFIFPITPSSTMAENYDQFRTAGLKNVWGDLPQVTEMQSEAGAIASCHGAAVGGSLTCSFTSSQALTSYSGLLLMVPNMFQLSGGLYPTVVHVAARNVSTNATSICGDHTDVMAVRGVNWGMLCSSSVQECYDNAIIAHIAAMKTSVPFMHFFEGFQLSHQVTNIKMMNNPDIKQLIPDEAITRLRERALNPMRPKRLNCSSGRDVAMQLAESSNIYFNSIPDVVEDTMAEFEALTGRKYSLFKYSGHPEAEDILVTMGAGSGIMDLAADYLQKKGRKVGVLTVKLFRPWSVEHFNAALPKSVKRIAVMDRSKDGVAPAEPLMEDVCTALNQLNMHTKVIGGRYAISEKSFDTHHAIAIFDYLATENPKTSFSVGVNDDVTHLSIPVGPPVSIYGPETKQCVFWGLGGDGTVGANKQAIDILTEFAGYNAQAHFVYSAHKSGAITVSHVRFGKQELVDNSLISKDAAYIACHHPSYISKIDMFGSLAQNGIAVINTPWNEKETIDNLPIPLKIQLAQKNAQLYVINAAKVASKCGLGGAISMVTQSVFLNLSKFFPWEEARDHLRRAAQRAFGKKYGPKMVEKNHNAIDNALAELIKVNYPVDEWKKLTVPAELKVKMSKNEYLDICPTHLQPFIQGYQKPVIDRKGNSIPVSSFSPDGLNPTGTAKFEKRGIARLIPEWDAESCSQCHLCSLVCPHAAIRPYILSADEMKGVPKGMETVAAKELSNMHYRLQVSPMDCTGCNLCVNTCPDEALELKDAPSRITIEKPYWDYLEKLPIKNKLLDKWNVRGSQLQQPLLEFSGACEGCGETPYAKLLTQLFGRRMLIAQATGCASVWGSFAPASPYTTDATGRGPAFARSLFEDAAEFGYGIHDVFDQRREALVKRVISFLEDAEVNESPLGKALKNWLDVKENADKADGITDTIIPLLEQELASSSKYKDKLQYLYENRFLFIKPSKWVFGGDGWANDIGNGGLDHVMALGKKINVMVMDNEVYANTGGQASKSTPVGAVAKFASGGKRTQKRDIGRFFTVYGNVYVAAVSLSHPEHLIKTLKEAESYDGPSLIHAYCPCRDHVVSLSETVRLCRKAVTSGYWTLYRYDPRKDQPMQIDTEVTQPLEPFIEQQGRFRIVKERDPVLAKQMITELHDYVKKKQKWLKLLTRFRNTEVDSTEDEVISTRNSPSDEAKSIFHAKKFDWIGNRVPSNLVAVEPPSRKLVNFHFDGKMLQGYEGESISSALIANNIHIFGFHQKDKSPQGIFCANGQCSACRVNINGIAKKSCVESLKADMDIQTGLPSVLTASQTVIPKWISNEVSPPKEIDVLIIGGGPSGMSAALELGKRGHKVLIIDDKDRLGGKLVLQTHKFFGSVEDTRAGTRGTRIAEDMENDLKRYPNIEIKLETTAVGVFSDQVIGLKSKDDYLAYQPKQLLVATGAREKMISFPGNTLPGVFGAGAFQTLINRDWVKPASRVLIVGGGNVGLITGYHCIQAGIEVVGLVEALPECGGYKVHKDKLKRLGVPVMTSHTILAAHGKEHVNGATIAKVDSSFNPIKGTEMHVDCVLIAVGLDKVDEFANKAIRYNIQTSLAGDSQEIAEASAAMVSGRIAGLNIASKLEKNSNIALDTLIKKAKLLRSHGGAVHSSDLSSPLPKGISKPIIHCYQEIPCNACKYACQYSLIKMEGILGLPHYNEKADIECSGCKKCAQICPGLAITVVDTRKDVDNPLVTFPFEIDIGDELQIGKNIAVMDENGIKLGDYPIRDVEIDENIKTYLVTVQIPKEHSIKAASIWRQKAIEYTKEKANLVINADDGILCRCENVSIKEIKEAAKSLYDDESLDMNHIKATTRQGMGACGAKSCAKPTLGLLRRIGYKNVTSGTERPLFIEMPLNNFAKAPTPPPAKSRYQSLYYIDDQKKHTYDAIVMGAGSIGVPIALSLASEGKKVVCIDSNPSFGQNDNKRAIGGTRATFGQTSKVIMMLRSLDIFREMNKKQSIEWREDGYLFPVYESFHEDSLKSLLKIQQSHGLEIEWVNTTRMQQLLPGINPEGLRGGTYSPRDGHLSPLLTAVLFNKMALEKGVIFKYNEHIHSITRDIRGGVTGVNTLRKGSSPTRYYAPVVINALGAHCNTLLSTLGREIPITPDSHEAGITEPVKHMLKGLIVDIRSFPGSKNIYFYQNALGQIVFCLTPEPSIEGYDIEDTSAFLPQVAKRMIHLFPSIGTVSVRRTWRGIYANTADGNPYIGWDSDIKGLLHACAFGGQGLMLGPSVGELVSRVVLNKLTSNDKMILNEWNPNRGVTGGQELLR